MKKAAYRKELPRRLYEYFFYFSDSAAAPSFSKFARSLSMTLADVERFRCHSEFDAAYRECSEIRRDYLIDAALTRRFDPSLVKFLLDAEREKENALTSEEDTLNVRIEVLSEDGNAN